MKSSHLIGLKDWLRDFDFSFRAMRGVLGLLWVTYYLLSYIIMLYIIYYILYIMYYEGGVRAPLGHLHPT